MVSLAPLLESSFQVSVRKSSEARNVANTLGIGAMAGSARHDVDFRNTLQVNLSSDGREFPHSVIGGFGGQHRKIDSEIASCLCV